MKQKNIYILSCWIATVLLPLMVGFCFITSLAAITSPSVSIKRVNNIFMCVLAKDEQPLCSSLRRAGVCIQSNENQSSKSAFETQLGTPSCAFI